MTSLEKAAREFLSRDRYAVAGVSRNTGEAANIIFRKLRDTGREVYPINPKATEVEGCTCYPDLGSVPVRVDAVVIATPPSAAKGLVDACVELGVGQVWMHRAFGEGSVAREAVEVCRQNGIRVIPGGCPMMFCDPVDAGHKCIRWIAKYTGRLPKPV